MLGVEQVGDDAFFCGDSCLISKVVVPKRGSLFISVDRRHQSAGSIVLILCDQTARIDLPDQIAPGIVDIGRAGAVRKDGLYKTIQTVVDKPS